MKTSGFPTKLACVLFLTLAVGFGASLPSRAQTHILLDTGAFSGLGTFYLDFQLLDGNGAGDGNSVVLVSGLTLTGGTLGAIQPPTGDVQGDPTTLLTLRDSDPIGVSEYIQGFTVTGSASLLSFDITLNTTAPLDTPIPDAFNFLILLGDVSTPLPTDGPSGVELLNSEFVSLAPTLTGYPTTSDSPVILSAPQIGVAAPEPASETLLALGAGFMSLCLVRKRRLTRPMTANG